MLLYRHEADRTFLEAHVGDRAQIGGTRHYELSEGRARGVRAIDVETGGGLVFTVLPDRGMDIARASFKGVNLVYHSVTGEAHPAYYDPRGTEWLRGFFGGLLTTCGLTWLGPPCVDAERELGQHGRISHTPARRVRDESGWSPDGREYELRLVGEVEEAAPFGDKLRLTRTIATRLGANRLQIHDEVENFGFVPAPLTILYHINAGWPLLDIGARLALTARGCKGRDEVARQGFADRLRFEGPRPGRPEEVYSWQTCADGDELASVVLLNPALCGGLALRLRFDARSLPFVHHWKSLGAGDYVLGLEPSNVPQASRAELRERGQLPLLEPGERREFKLELEMLEGEAAHAECARIESLGQPQNLVALEGR